MSPLEAWFISLAAGGGAGVIGGVVVNWFLDRDRAATDRGSPEVFEPDAALLDSEIQDAARAWSEYHGRPGAEQLVADKLRLGVRLQERRARRDRGPRRRWSRW
jgi:hypothetical protein